METENQDINALFENAMIDLAMSYSVYAQLIARIGCKLVDDKYTPACAWTDGKAIYINKYMIEEFNKNPEVKDNNGRIYNREIRKQHLEFILCHELMHNIGLTWDRGKEIGVSYEGMSKEDYVKRDLWNQATDYEINSLLYNNSPNSVGRKPDFALYEEKYRDMCAEEIYADLLKKEKENPGSQSQYGNMQEINISIQGSNENSNGSGSGQSEDQNGTKENKGSSGCDNDSGQNYNNPEAPKKKGLGFGLDVHKPMFDDTTRDEIIQKMTEVFGSMENGINTGDNAIDRLLNSAFKPTPFNWKKALTKYIRGFIKGNYTWNKPSRSGVATGLRLPSTSTEPCMNIAVAVDTSGSISHLELDTMVNHIFTILNQFKEFKVDVWCCGSVVYPETFRTYTSKNKNSLAEFPLKSDGGNDMRENFKFIREKYKGNPPDVFIILSDFYDALNGDTETTSICPCIFMVIDHKDFVPPSRIKAEVYEYTIPNGKGQ